VKKVNRRLLTGLICYGVLIAIALYVLLPVRSSNEGFILGAVLFFFAFLILRTLIHSGSDLD